MPRVLLAACAAAAVAACLFVPIAGLRVADAAGGLRLAWQPWAAGGLVGAVFVAVLAGRVWRARTGSRPASRLGITPGWAGRAVAPALLAAAILLPLFAGRYLLDLGVLVLTYVMLGWGLNIVVGLAGLLDLGYVAFYAVGAYSYALLSTSAGLGFWTCLPLSGLFACAFGVLLGFPVLRLRGDYLAIVTLAFGEIIRVVITNWSSLTGGPNGISGIARPTLFGLRFAAGGPHTFAGALGVPFSPTQRLVYLYYIILGLALLTNFVTLRLRRLPLGRAWEALREDETACRSLGINVAVTKLTAFAIGATSGGFAGAFFATRQAFVSPESFTFIESATVLAIVVLGGLGSQLGVALAAVGMIGGLELLREGLSVLSLDSGGGWVQGVLGDFGQFRMLIFGLALVVVMVWRPRGLVTGRRPSVSLGGEAARAISAELVAQGRG